LPQRPPETLPYAGWARERPFSRSSCRAVCTGGQSTAAGRSGTRSTAHATSPRTRRSGGIVAELSRLSFNQMTAGKAPPRQVVDACMKHGIQWIGPWRHAVGEDPGAAAKLIREAGLRVSSLCRGGMFPAATAEERRKRIEDNLRAIDEAAALGTDLLVLVNGPAPDRDIDGARQMVV